MTAQTFKITYRNPRTQEIESVESTFVDTTVPKSQPKNGPKTTGTASQIKAGIKWRN